MMKRYAFVDYGGTVLSIETRCSCFYRKDKQEGEISIEDIIHPELIYRYVEIPDGVDVTEGMIYSGGEFKQNPMLPTERLTSIEKELLDTQLALCEVYETISGGEK